MSTLRRPLRLVDLGQGSACGSSVVSLASGRARLEGMNAPWRESRMRHSWADPSLSLPIRWLLRTVTRPVILRVRRVCGIAPMML
jgi:hypothetical protein